MLFAFWEQPLRNLISRPDTPWHGFRQGLGSTLVAVGIPIATIVPIRAGSWEAFGVSIPIALGLSLLGGLGLALWRLIQCWAYDHFTGDNS